MKKQSPSILMVISLFSPGQGYDANFLTNYCTINLKDQILRIRGVAQVDMFGGSDYSMRIWLRPDKLAKLGLTPSDAISAIKEQNLQAPSGQIGMPPSPKDQEFTYTVRAPAGWSPPRSPRTSSSASRRPGPRSRSRTWAAPSWAPRRSSRRTWTTRSSTTPRRPWRPRSRGSSTCSSRR